MRVRGGTVRKRRHKKILSKTKGYRMTKSRNYKVAHEAYLHARQYAYDHRQKRQGQLRRLWITRLSAASKQAGISYRTLIDKMNKSNVVIDRKILADIAVRDFDKFAAIVNSL